MMATQSPSTAAIVRSLYAAFSRHDMAAILALLSPDVEWSEPAHPFNPAAGTRRGHDGFLEWAKVGSEAEDILALDVRRILVDGDTVAVLGHMRCRAKATGKVYVSDFVHIVEFRAGLITKCQEFFDTYAAGEAFRPLGTDAAE